MTSLPSKGSAIEQVCLEPGVKLGLTMYIRERTGSEPATEGIEELEWLGDQESNLGS